MKKAVSARCTLVGGILLTFALAAMGAAGGSGSTEPKVPLAPPTLASSAVSPEKKNKLAENMAQGARALKFGQFEEAVAWYKAASQLDASDQVMQALQGAIALRDKRTKALEKVPADEAKRKQFLDKSFELAKKQYDDRQYDKAVKSFTDIWLVAGNYQGSTVELIDQAKKMQGPAPKSPLAQPVVLTVANPPAKAAVAAPAPAPAVIARPAEKTTPMPTLVAEAAPAKAEPAPAAPASRPLPPPVVIFDPAPAAAAPAAPAPAKVVSARTIPAIEPVAYEPASAGSPNAQVIDVDIKGLPKTDAVAPAAAAPAVEDPSAANISDVTRLQVDRYLKIARDLNAAGKPAEARAQLAKALELWPGNLEAKALLGDLEKQIGGAPRALVDNYLTEGDALAAEGKFGEAALRYDEALKLDPTNADAAARKAKADRLTVKSAAVAEIKGEAATRRTLDQLHDQALKALEAKDIKKARETWQRILELDPQDKKAQVCLENTKAEWERYQADQAVRVQAQQLSEQDEKLLGSPISISTTDRISLDEFIKNVSVSTAVEMNYSINAGAKTQVYGNFQNMALRDVLDTVLLPNGLSWSLKTVNNTSVIVIDQKLITRTYSLSPAQMSKVRTLDASGELKKNIWGQIEPPAEGCSITLDERQNLLVITGSTLHVQRIESLLPNLKSADAQEMIVRIYKINANDGPKIKSLINSIISATEGGFDMERKIFIDKDDLIVRDVPENIKKIEELLLDKKFIQDMTKQKLDIANFSLVPRETETISDQVRQFTARVVEAIEVFLYTQEGKAKAAEEGRRLWFDPYTLQLTVVDTPANLARVSQYINALPELGQKTKTETIFLTYAVAEDLTGSLQRIMDITNGGTGGAAGANGGQGGNEIVFQLRQGEVKQWRDINLRLIRVRDPYRQQQGQNRGGGGGGGNQIDRTQGSAEFSLDTGYQTQQRTMQVLTSDYADNYRITLEKVTAQGGNTGMGSATFRVAYVPQAQRNAMNSLQSQTMGDQAQPQQTQSLEETGLTITPAGALNAIVIRYTDAKLYQDVLDLINQLDKPMMQVSIETKFVEVNETRAKEFSADFDFAGLGSGQGAKNLDWGTNRFNSRFAQDSDEFRDIFSPPIENPLSANLIKGTTVLNAVIGNQNPLLNFSLRFLEAEGVLNMVNGPRVTSVDGVQASFEISLSAPTAAAGTAPTSTNSAVTFNVLNPLSNTGGGGGGQLIDSQVYSSGNMISGVTLNVTPQITSQNSIILSDLRAQLLDYEGWLGDVLNVTYAQAAASSNPALFSVSPAASANTGQAMIQGNKYISTTARVNNGGTIILGGWTSERSQELTSGVPILRNMPYLGKLLFSRNQRSNDRTTLMIFLTCYIVE